MRDKCLSSPEDSVSCRSLVLRAFSVCCYSLVLLLPNANIQAESVSIAGDSFNDSEFSPQFVSTRASRLSRDSSSSAAGGSSIQAATSQVFLRNDLSSIDVTAHLEHFEDPYHGLEFADVLAGRIPSDYRTTMPPSFNLGFGERVFWFRLVLNGRHLQRSQEWVGEGQKQSLQNFVIYVPNDNGPSYSPSGFSITRGGSDFNFDSRKINHRNLIFKFTLRPNETKTIYFRTKSTHAVSLPVTLWEKNEFASAEVLGQMMWGSFFGVFLILSLGGAFAFWRTKQVAYFYFCILPLSVAMICLVATGYGFQMLWPNWPKMNYKIFIVAFATSIVCATQFARHFFGTEAKWPMINISLQLQTILALCLALFALSMSHVNSGVLFTLSSICFIVVMLATGLHAVREKVNSARYFLAAWCLLFAFIELWALATIELIIPVSPFTLGLKYVGLFLSMLVLSLAVINRLNSKVSMRGEQLFSKGAESSEEEFTQGLPQYRSLHDEAINLPNRKMLERQLPEKIENAVLGDKKLAVVLVRLNRLHDNYNALGLRTKEELSIGLANQLCDILSDDRKVHMLECIGRSPKPLAVFDAQSFLFVMELSEDEKPNDVFEEYLTAKLYPLLLPVDHGGLAIDLDVAIGAAFVPDHGLDSSMVLRHAEVAVETAPFKHKKVMVYSSSADTLSARWLSLATSLNEAIEKNYLLIEFHPQLDLKTDGVSAVEALLRWYHPVYGIISPEETIRVAEKSGLMKPLMQWLLDSVFRQAGILLRTFPQLIFSVNLSSYNLRESDLVQDLLRRLVEFGVEASNIKIEITETDMMAEPEIALAVMNRLVKLGVNISIDNFGVGHSSMSQLGNLPAHELKIDRSLTAGIRGDVRRRSIVQAIVNMGHDLNLQVVAEGVEDLEALNALKHMECDYAQGFFISLPIPAKQLMEWMIRRETKNKVPDGFSQGATITDLSAATLSD